jgi:phytanoyl-CoA dioxygenase PhyH
MKPIQVSDAGYRIIEDVISSEECDELLAALSAAELSMGRAGARHLLSIPAVGDLARDVRLLDIARKELRAEPFPFRATLFAKSGRANWLVVWHQDTALPLKQRTELHGWGPWSEKAGVVYAHAPAWALERVIALRVHLDSSTDDNGPLRVIAQTHLHGVLTDDDVGRIAKQSRAINCSAARGGVVLMRPLLIHSSSKVRTDADRRVLHIEYAETQCLAPGIELQEC